MYRRDLRPRLPLAAVAPGPNFAFEFLFRRVLSRSYHYAVSICFHMGYYIMTHAQKVSARTMKHGSIDKN